MPLLSAGTDGAELTVSESATNLQTVSANSNFMINVAAHVQPEAHELAITAREHLDDLVTFATHLVGSSEDAVEFVAGGIYHASRYPPARLRVDGRAALYRAVTRACLEQGIEAVRPGRPISDIGRAIQRQAEPAGFGVVRHFCGVGQKNAYKREVLPAAREFFGV